MLNFKDQNRQTPTKNPRPTKKQPRYGTAMFATTMPGLAPILVEELRELEIAEGGGNDWL